ncbi:MAG: amidohydrolase family protein [Pseudomonadota bacterium]
MAIIDSQVHAYEANTPKRPWHTVPNWPDHVTGDEMAAAMDKVGVDGAIFISSFSMYRYDASYAIEVQRAHPGRLAIVKPVDPDDPAVADVIAAWKETPGAVGIRIMLRKEEGRQPSDPGFDRILRAAVRHDFPVNILCWDNLTRARRSSIAIRRRGSSSTIWVSCSRACRPRRRSPGPISRRCWHSPSVRTR